MLRDPGAIVIGLAGLLLVAYVVFTVASGMVQFPDRLRNNYDKLLKT